MKLGSELVESKSDVVVASAAALPAELNTLGAIADSFDHCLIAHQQLDLSMASRRPGRDVAGLSLNGSRFRRHTAWNY